MSLLCPGNRQFATKTQYKIIPSNKATPGHSCPTIYKKENSNLT
jgi:hypothetical protein